MKNSLVEVSYCAYSRSHFPGTQLAQIAIIYDVIVVVCLVQPSTMEEQTLLFERLTQPRSGLWIKINKKNLKIIYIQKLLYVFKDIQSILLTFSKNTIYVVENVLATLCVNCYDLE